VGPPRTPSEDSRIIGAARTLCPPRVHVVELAPKGMPRWFVRGKPRWFVPMDTWRVRLSGSRIYPALSAKARAYRTALRAWITIGGAQFTHHTYLKIEHDWTLRELLRSDMPTLSTAAISIGGAIPGGRKITAQLMDERGHVLGFAKYASNAYTRAAIANEARMLEGLPENVGPRVIRFTPFLDGDLLVQTHVQGRMRVHMRIDAAQREFYERLIRTDEVYPASQHPYLLDLHKRADGQRDFIENVIEDLDRGAWPVAWMHGDLAPYNMRWRRAGCQAFDWEHGKEIGFPYLDGAAMLIQVAKIRRLDARTAKRAVSESLSVSLPARYSNVAPVLASLSALNMLITWYPPRQPDSFESWLREFMEA
jgi:hypothetical protein